MDEDAFLADDMAHSATIQALLIMGEGTKRLTMAIRDEHPQIDWRGMAGMRDVLIHHYNRVDLQMVWKVAIREVPGIVGYLERLLPAEGE